MAIFISISVAVISIFDYMSVTINSIQDERAKKAPLTSFSFVTSTNVRTRVKLVIYNDIVRQAFLRFIDYIKVAADKIFNRLIN